MKLQLRTLLIVNAVLDLVGAVGLLLAPAQLLALYAMTTGPTEQLLARLVGVGLIGIALLTWLMRDVSDGRAQRGLILGLLIADVVAVVVSLTGVLSGVLNAVGWSAVAIYVLLGLGYAYFQFVKHGAS
jgi:hypothetical protein